MTREEEIRQAQVAIYGTENCRAAEHFEQGARWADKTMLDRACEWLGKHIHYDYVGNFGFWVNIASKEDFINQFKKAML